MVLLEHLSDVDIARNHVASLRSEPSAVVISGDAPCVTLTTEPTRATRQGSLGLPGASNPARNPGYRRWSDLLAETGDTDAAFEIARRAITARQHVPS